jgi:hypothetical protein
LYYLQFSSLDPWRDDPEVSSSEEDDGEEEEEEVEQCFVRFTLLLLIFITVATSC